MARVYQADYRTTVDQATPDWLVWDSISGRAQTVIKSWYGDVGLSMSDSFWGLLSYL